MKSEVLMLKTTFLKETRNNHTDSEVHFIVNVSRHNNTEML